MAGQKLGPLTQLTINLCAPAKEALDKACQLRGDNATDTVNQALLGYAVLCEQASKGGVRRLRWVDAETGRVDMVVDFTPVSKPTRVPTALKVLFVALLGASLGAALPIVIALVTR